ncbi:hypothetical protein HPB49_021593 [Dermacentor silvarum]|uniref:Uncharacterized protein n=1 Tax=Dermacentor silvarum TaxID=543639 RepID=A0ACB8C5J3_DERSI|nr:hypothetical protein HPB49_021593 [Dermacentor silvarum]
MATSAPDLKILALRDSKSRGQAVSSGAPTAHSSTAGPRPETLSPSPPPVRIQVVGGASSQRDQARPSRDFPVYRRHPVAALEATQPQDERFCIVLWVVGASLAFPLVLSAWLVVVPLVVHANWTTLVSPPPVSASPPSSTPFSSTTVVPTTSTSPGQNFLSACLAPLTLPALAPRLNVSAPDSFGPSNESSRPIFCLFNNTRAYGDPGGGSRWNYVFAAVPFALCPHIIYWSVGIENGNLTSRQPVFDELYGLQRLRAVADALNFTAVKILLALGGYPQDGPHFSTLGRDDATMGRLVNNVVDSVYRLGLNGVTVHWVEARADCQGTDDVGVLSRLLRSLRRRFDARSGGLVTVMLELNARSQFVARETADVVDHFFLATQNERTLNWVNIQDFCEAGTNDMHVAYRWFASALPAMKLRRSQLCLTDSLMPFHASTDLEPKLVLQYTRTDFRRVPLYLECEHTNICEIHPPHTSCIFHFFVVKSSPGLQDDLLFLIDDVSTLRKRLDFAEINATQLASAPGDSPHACVLLLDLDSDNYADQCGGRFYRYALMRNYYYGTLGKTLSGGGAIRDTYAVCKQW